MLSWMVDPDYQIGLLMQNVGREGHIRILGEFQSGVRLSFRGDPGLPDPVAKVNGRLQQHTINDNTQGSDPSGGTEP